MARALGPQSLVGDVDTAELVKFPLLTDNQLHCSPAALQALGSVLVLGFRLAALTVPEVLASTSLSCPAVPHTVVQDPL